MDVSRNLPEFQIQPRTPFGTMKSPPPPRTLLKWWGLVRCGPPDVTLRKIAPNNGIKTRMRNVLPLHEILPANLFDPVWGGKNRRLQTRQTCTWFSNLELTRRQANEMVDLIVNLMDSLPFYIVYTILFWFISMYVLLNFIYSWFWYISTNCCGCVLLCFALCLVVWCSFPFSTSNKCYQKNFLLRMKSLKSCFIIHLDSRGGVWNEV